jgi:ligand-binding SRPBCC domain-containing protein
MTTIKLSTQINAPVEVCFDISRDIGIHELSTKDTKERAVAGKTSGLCELNDEITWEATHFGIKQRLTVRITKLYRPDYFEDIMLKGAFKSMKHEHYFKDQNGITAMDDIFTYKVPFGFIGRLFDRIILCKYMTKFLKTRNEIIKDIAENASR